MSLFDAVPKKIRTLFSIILVLGVFSSMGTTCGGSTNTGNPNVRIAQSYVLLLNICDKLTSCYETLSYDDCDPGVRANQSLISEIGLSHDEAEDFAVYNDVIDAEITGDITPNTEHGATCSNDIAALACDSSQVQAAFDPADPENYENITSLLSHSANSCKGIF